MTPKLVTFDCAQTLVRVDWQPAVIAVKAASLAGVSFERSVAAEVYDRKLRSRWPEFQRLNLSRNREVLDNFWMELTVDWMTEVGMDASLAPSVFQHADSLLFGEGSRVFQLYDDTVPTLEALAAAGVRMAVLSNWDNSLHRTLEMFDLTRYFEFVIASLEEGVEKPDARIFQIALERGGVEAGDVLHVGDSAVDDWQGAKGAGLHAMLIDREADAASKMRLTSLTQLPERLGL